MHKYIPVTPSGAQQMLDEIGASSINDLFLSIPENVRLSKKLNLPDGKSELEVGAHLRTLASQNTNVLDTVCFLGAGAYDHYCPSAVDQLLLRQEFFTAYTPYQAEISQGTLQATFEYQSYICMLTGMDTTNASMYDGATALAEAAIMACVIGRKNEVLVSETVAPQSRQVLETYAKFRDIKITTIGIKNGKCNLDDVKEKLSSNTAAVIVQSPNFFGVVEDTPSICEATHNLNALMIQSCDPLSLALLESPGTFDVDIVVGDAQSLGLPLNYGGPYLGFLACKQKFARKMPGRIVGQTLDTNGRTGYVMTMQAREQHIKRQKATSNICSNHALNAIAVTIYLSLLGKKGLTEVANQCMCKAHYAFDELVKTGKFEPMFDAPFFMEFALKYKGDIKDLNSRLLDNGILGGYNLSKDYPLLENTWLVAVTEKRTKAQIDNLVQKAVSI